MTGYSLIKMGNEYVVRANGHCILKLSSRRRAAQLICDATLRLNAERNAQSSRQVRPLPSSGREKPELP